MNNHIRMKFDEWEAQYKPVKNTVPDSEGANNDETGTMFETFGNDLDFVRKQNVSHIWTLLDCDGDMVISSGYHLVNRMSYFITKVPCASGLDVEVVYAYGDRPYPVMWEGEGDNEGLIYGVEYRIYETRLPDGEPDLDSHADVMHVEWFATKEERDEYL